MICVVLIAFGYSGLPFWPQGKTYDAYFTDAVDHPCNSFMSLGLAGAVSAVSLAGNSAKVTFSVDRSIARRRPALAAIRNSTPSRRALHRGQSGWLRQVDHDLLSR